jgi:ribonuclease HI
VINCVTKWMPGWKKKGWRKADGKPVLNVELLKEIDAAIVGRTYRFEWVKGHANHPLNEAADTRARAASEAFQRGRPVDAGPGWTRDGDADVAAPAVTWTPDAEPVAAAAPSLFSFDDDDLAAAPAAVVEVTARLTPQQHERLRALASRRGVSVEQALAELV